MSKNDITGDEIRSKPNSSAYRSQYDKIFGNSGEKSMKSAPKKKTAKKKRKPTPKIVLPKPKKIKPKRIT